MNRESRPQSHDEVLSQERAYHEQLYSGEAQALFAKPAVREMRAHLVRNIIEQTGATQATRVLSLGCGIGDTELLLAPHVRELVGVDFAPSAIRQARHDATRAGLRNVEFLEGDVDHLDLAAGSFDLVIGILFLHHLSDDALDRSPALIRRLLRPGGKFYGLDSSAHRLSGIIGSLLIPGLMRKYHSPGERELNPGETARRFQAAGYTTRIAYYDFASTPISGLLPSSSIAYRIARTVDDVLVRTPFFCRLGSSFELLATAPSDHARPRVHDPSES